ncbi:MAG: AMP-dependent synthetase/ligase [Frankiaceae bacterium]
MREIATRPAPGPCTSKSLSADLVASLTRDPGRYALSRQGPDGWTYITAQEFLEQVQALAKGFIAAGLSCGDRIAVMSHTRFEWTLVDCAALLAGLVTVPVYETATAEHSGWVLDDAGVRAAVVETLEHAALVRSVTADRSSFVQVWTLEDGAVETLTACGIDVPDQALQHRIDGLSRQSAATIIYTSGTSGPPKGCALSHGNFLTELDAVVAALGEVWESEDSATLLYLPLAHILARLVQFGSIRAGVRLGHCHDAGRLGDDLRSFRPTFLLVVPRVLEKVYNTASQRAAADGKGRQFDRGSEVAIETSRASQSRGRHPFLRARYATYERAIYARVREALGGDCRYVISGGAPLGERLAHFFNGIGVTVLEGYGLTETTGAVTVNAPAANKVGSVGRPLPGVAVRVADDGKLEVRGGQVFTGYWNDPDPADLPTADGWLRTGDLGEIDDEGFVTITGRKTDIIVTAGGKNVSPTLLEERVRAHRLVSQCLVVGDGRPFVGALVTLDADAACAWARGRSQDAAPDDLVGDPALREEIQSAVDWANEAVSRAEAIRAFTVVPGQWTAETGELTPSLKLKRSVLTHRYRAEIDALYDGGRLI